MRRLSTLLAVVLRTGIVVLAAGAGEAAHVPGEIMVRFRPGVAARNAREIVEAEGVRKVDSIERMRIWLVKVPPGRSVEDVIVRLKRNPNVETAEPNPRVYRKELPNDPLLAQQWSLEAVKAVLAWGMTVTGAKGDPGVVIAYVDDGISHSHPDLAAKIVPGYNAMDGSDNDDADGGVFDDHGTFGAAIAAGATDNSTGISGVAWHSRLMPVKVFDAYGRTSEFYWMKGVIWAVDNGAKVVNISLGTCENGAGGVECADGTELGAAVVRYAYLDRGAVIVAAAGNEGTDGKSYPAAYPYVIGVAAIDNSGKATTYTNHGAYIDVSAPGGAGVASCSPGGEMLAPTSHWLNACAGLGVSPDDYTTKAGTSFASPMVAGVASVLFGQNPARTNDDVVALILSTADQPTGAAWTEAYGHGRLDMYAALTATQTGQAVSALSAAVAVSPPVPVYGQEFVVAAVARNTGSGVARDVAGDLVVTAGSSLVSIDSWPDAAEGVDLAPGESRSFSWRATALDGGAVGVSFRAAGVDAATGNVVRGAAPAVFTIGGLVSSGGDAPVAYPNPVSGDTFNLGLPLKADATAVTVWVYGAGSLKLVYRGRWRGVSVAGGGVIVRGVGGWAPGMYLVKATADLVTGEEQVFSPAKVMVKR